ATSSCPDKSGTSLLPVGAQTGVPDPSGPACPGSCCGDADACARAEAPFRVRTCAARRRATDVDRSAGLSCPTGSTFRADGRLRDRRARSSACRRSWRGGFPALALGAAAGLLLRLGVFGSSGRIDDLVLHVSDKRIERLTQHRWTAFLIHHGDALHDGVEQYQALFRPTFQLD